MDSQKIFPICKAKALLHTAGAMVFVLIAASMVNERPFFGWFSVLLFGAFALLGGIRLCSDVESLRLDKNGFEIAGIFKRSRYQWKDIQSIQLTTIQRVSVIAVDCKDDFSRRSKGARTLTRMDAKIANIYDASLDEIYLTLQVWHGRFGSTA